MKKTSHGLMMNRRTLLTAGSVALGLASLNLPLRRALAIDSFEQGPVVDTADGKLRGLVDRDISVFRGIPYGAPTGGANRFLPPKKPQPWTHVREAFAFGNSAPQTDADGKVLWGRAAADDPIKPLEDWSRDPAGVAESEDCLYLNVTTPSLSPAARKPVMVWLHGGGYFSGSASWDLYQGDNLARANDVVFVSVNHRLNAFGFTYFGELLGPDYVKSGNAGQLDIVQALQWVHDNIESFGGDPNNVTIFGESGGGEKVSMLMTMPSAKGLFHRAIIESGPFTKAGTLKDAKHTAEVFLAELNLKASQLRELQELPTRRLVSAYYASMAKLRAANTSGGYNEYFAPMVDEVTLPRNFFSPDAAPEGATVPLIIGFNRAEYTIMYTMGQPMILNMDEATLRQRMLETPGATPKVVDRVLAAYKKQYPKATPWERYIDITSDTGFGITSIRIAELKAAQGGAPVYLYRFDYETTKLGGHIRSMHGTEIPFVFNNIKNTAWMVDDTPETNALAAHMSAAWAAFARTGNPNTGALPEWPTFDTKSRSTMIFNLTSRVEHDPEHDARVSVEQLAPRS